MFKQKQIKCHHLGSQFLLFTGLSCSLAFAFFSQLGFRHGIMFTRGQTPLINPQLEKMDKRNLCGLSQTIVSDNMNYDEQEDHMLTGKEKLMKAPFLFWLLFYHGSWEAI